MSPQELSELPYRSLWPFCRMVAAACESGRLVELNGVRATIVPVTPTRSITNSVVYERPEALERALESLAASYAEAGVRAWTVWVPKADRAAQDILEAAGHEVDAEPAAMAIELDHFDHSASPDLDLDTAPSAHDIGRINDIAYGFEGDFIKAFEQRPSELNLYAARLDGKAVACVGSIHERDDCGIYLVATEPEARGRGLAGDLVTVALEHARAAGCRTGSLQSTPMGKPVYARLGFQDFGAIQMWERRSTSGAE
jgi:GNAT superfamily N-acetyltransferase